MESTSEPMKIHISQTTHELLGADYSTTDRGEIVVKGKGTIHLPSFSYGLDLKKAGRRRPLVRCHLNVPWQHAMATETKWSIMDTHTRRDGHKDSLARATSLRETEKNAKKDWIK